MARRTKKTTKAERRRETQMRVAQQETLIARHTAEMLCCSAETAADFIASCMERLEDVESEMEWGRLASRVWSEHARDAQLAQLLDQFVEEQERHMTAIGRLALRFEAVAKAGHRHLPAGAVGPEEVYTALFPTPDVPPPSGEGASVESRIDSGAGAAMARVVP